MVEGGRLAPDQLPGEQGVVVSNQTRLGRIGYYSADHERPSGSTLSLADVGHDEDDKVQCIVLLRKDEDTLPALKDVKAKVKRSTIPTTGRMLPGYEDRALLRPHRPAPHHHRDRDAKTCCLGIALVVAILFMFVNNIRTAIIVAINIPLALLFAFTMLYLRGKSANLLSIGAVDFGIIVDSSVIVVENIYRNLASGNYPDLPLKERILLFVQEIDHALLFSVADHGLRLRAAVHHDRPGGTALRADGADLRVLPGRRPGAGPDADAGAVHAALQELQAGPGEHAGPRSRSSATCGSSSSASGIPKTTCVVMAFLIGGTACLIPQLGREFMPELEEGNLWLRGIGPLNMNLEHQVAIAKQARAIMASYPEVESIVTQSGRPDDGTDTEGYYNSEYFVPLRPRRTGPS